MKATVTEKSRCRRGKRVTSVDVVPTKVILTAVPVIFCGGILSVYLASIQQDYGEYRGRSGTRGEAERAGVSGKLNSTRCLTRIC